MSKITRDPDGSCHWDCSVDADFHRRSGRQGIWGILGLCAFVLVIFFFVSRGTDVRNDWWIPLLVIGVILVIGLPLLFLWNSAPDPHEQYLMTEDYVKSGYGKSSIFSEFKKTRELLITPKYLELTGPRSSNRIYVPEEDMDFVRNFITERMPDEVNIRYN